MGKILFKSIEYDCTSTSTQPKKVFKIQVPKYLLLGGGGSYIEMHKYVRQCRHN